MSEEKASKRRVVTPKFLVSFPAVFSPQEFNGKERYSVTMLLDKKDDIAPLKQLIKDVAEEKWGKVPKPMKTPFRDGDEEKDLAKYPMYEGKYFAAATSNFQPGLVDQKRQPIIDESEFYAGCYARASVSAYAWEYMGKKGVSFNLLNVQKMADGEKIGGGVTASDEFGEVEVEVSDNDDFDL